ncbi:MAG: inhibitor of KinA [Cyclobacteriaceae bacterium]|jgi:inhibitor of KinA
MSEISYKRIGESVLLIEWPAEISEENLIRILNIQHGLNQQQIEGILEMWPAYRSLAIHYNPETVSHEQLILKIDSHKNQDHDLIKPNRWLIPVCYESEYALDLLDASKQLKLNPEEVIYRHCAVEYKVHFMGFLPGFMYLGGLDQSINLPRKPAPKRSVPKGAVAIGGFQTGIYPSESPGGWHVIGNSPLRFFDVTAENPCFIQPGDTVRFEAVTHQEYKVSQLETRLDVFDLNAILKNG